MSKQLEYQECYRKPGHESVINTMVLSPDGHRLLTGSDDSSVLVWSTKTGAILCRIKARSPVLSLAWLTNSNGFLFGCKNGLVASVNTSGEYVATSYFKGHSAGVCCLSPRFNDISPISATMDDVKIWTRTVGRTEGQVERWELKVKVDSPSMLNRHREVVVTSVNWIDQAAATRVSRVLVSYRWHGIVCWDITKMTILQHWPMDECGTLSLSPDSKFAATFGLSEYFEVHELKSGAIQKMQWKPLIDATPASHRIGNMKAAIRNTPLESHHKLAKGQPVCFAHEGFAVAGAASEESVYVWDAERGDELLSLDHGEGSKVRALVAAFLGEDNFMIVTGTERHGKHYVFLWATVPRSVPTYTVAGQRIELGFTQNFWVNVVFITVLVATLSGLVVYYGVAITAAAT